MSKGWAHEGLGGCIHLFCAVPVIQLLQQKLDPRMPSNEPWQEYASCRLAQKGSGTSSHIAMTGECACLGTGNSPGSSRKPAVGDQRVGGYLLGNVGAAWHGLRLLLGLN